jgi:hypothetical protein
MRSLSQPSDLHVKMDVFIGMFRNFLQADECVYVMENGSKIKIDSSVKSKKLNVKSYGTERVAGYGLRVAGNVQTSSKVEGSPMKWAPVAGFPLRSNKQDKLKRFYFRWVKRFLLFVYISPGTECESNNYKVCTIHTQKHPPLPNS